MTRQGAGSLRETGGSLIFTSVRIAVRYLHVLTSLVLPSRRCDSTTSVKDTCAPTSLYLSRVNILATLAARAMKPISPIISRQPRIDANLENELRRNGTRGLSLTQSGLHRVGEDAESASMMRQSLTRAAWHAVITLLSSRRTARRRFSLASIRATWRQAMASTPIHWCGMKRCE